ncbi:hypothetical protein P8C59_005707 [Phyllachora maydis]|uniref:Uncharacterized protein n=1 Tax=Phyllachora maydis TaxID=1825666 RepID=A0AAD9I651_9PEZI|nr:hypothetical protein P8C59_005707 [Phyllachora maydis]
MPQNKTSCRRTRKSPSEKSGFVSERVRADRLPRVADAIQHQVPKLVSLPPDGVQDVRAVAERPLAALAPAAVVVDAGAGAPVGTR